jgi:uncharacterized membrane protein YoaK (UPF0700 family)
MDWHYVLHYLFEFIVKMAILLAFYYVPKSYFKYLRKDKFKPITLLNKIWFIFLVMISSLIVSGIGGNAAHTKVMEETIILLFITILPSLVGLLSYFEKDSKMTLKDRIEFKIFEDRNNLENPIDDRY